MLLTVFLCSCGYVPQDGYELKYQIEFLDLSGKTVETHIVDPYTYSEQSSFNGIKVYIGKSNDPSNITYEDFIVWSGPYRITRKEVIKTELERP